MPATTPKTGRPAAAPRAGRLLAAAAAAAALVGCAAPVERRAAAPQAAAGAPAWESLFLAPGAEAALAGIDPASLPEHARNDADLSPRDPGPLLATNQWPVEPAPSLLFRRRVFYADTERTGVFYFEPYPYHRLRSYHDHRHDGRRAAPAYPVYPR